ncbi:hypothetical protein [Erythrobacter alti]|uniref:hypothetical protein n=1 Tax=Erythrobacter alti TaxID=1896145 RepID=UPI0030F3D336
MKAQLARIIAFFVFVIPGFWYFFSHNGISAWLVLIGCFILGNIAARLVFKRLATDKQRREDLTARLFND